MKARTQTADGVALLQITGEIDLANADDLRDLGQDALAGDVSSLRIDLAGVTFIDSTGLGALVAINNQAGRAGQAVILVNLPQRVRRLLELTALDQVFQIEVRSP